MVVEELKASDELRQENEDLRIATGETFTSHAYRLSFFRPKLTRWRDFDKVKTKDFIGYAIVKRDSLRINQSSRCHVYESVIRKSQYPHNFVRGEQSWDCLVNGQPFAVKGYLYAEQNKITNVCAHAALRTVAARFPQGKHLSYREMNRIVGIDHKNKKADAGLNSEEITGILETVGARCVVGDFTGAATPPAPFQKYIYGSIESGFPAIVFFGTTSSHDSYHVIPIFGHTFNQDTWVPSADRVYFRVGAGTKYIPSDSWVSMFVGHDDNLGSNLCVPRHYLQTKRHPGPSDAQNRSQSDVESVAFIIGTMPKQVGLNPLQAEVIGADFLFTILPQLPNVKTNKWSRRLSRFASEHQLVLRPLLITGTEYSRHLKHIADWRGDRVDKSWISSIKNYIREDRLWMIELSVPELFSANKRKVGEVLLRADTVVASKRHLDNFFFARLPGYFSLYQRGGASNPKYSFIKSGVDGHVPLYGCEASAR